MDSLPASSSRTHRLQHEVVYNYVQDVDPNLTCVICQSALVDPVTTPCQHTFCRDCIITALKCSATCPIDRGALRVEDLRDTVPLVCIMLDELKVSCGAPGCGKVMERGMLVSHLRTCSRALAMCSVGCGIMIPRDTLAHHHAYECFRREMECSRCGVVVTFKAEGEHRCTDSDTSRCKLCGHGAVDAMHAWKCPVKPITCLYQRWGCGAVIPREDLLAHLQICPFAPLQAFFEENNSRIAELERRQEALEAENLTLRSELSLLMAELLDPARSFLPPHDTLDLLTQRQVRSARIHSQGEQETASRAASVSEASQHPTTRNATLGNAILDLLPATTADPQVPASPPAMPVQTLSSTTALLTSQASAITPAPAFGLLSRTTTSEGLMRTAPGAGPRAAAIGEDTLSNTSDSAPPRPQRSADRPRSLPTLQGRRTVESSPHPALHRSLRYLTPQPSSGSPAPRLPSYQTHTEWVLDRLSSAGTVSSPEYQQSFRAALVHLASGLDASERRSELRTMTSSLRVMEEVEALRAIVSPMRMQVLSEPPHPRPASQVSSVSSGPSEGLLPQESEENGDQASIPESVVFTPGHAGGTSTVITGGRWSGRPCQFPPANSPALGTLPGHRSLSALSTSACPTPTIRVQVTTYNEQSSQRAPRSTNDVASGGRSEGSNATITPGGATESRQTHPRTVRRFGSISAIGSMIRGRFDRTPS